METERNKLIILKNHTPTPEIAQLVLKVKVTSESKAIIEGNEANND